MENKDTRLDLLRLARNHWNAMAQFRADRDRCKRYAYGRQWDDTVVVDGVAMREADYIRSQGNIPLKNNLIRRIVRNVLGVFRNNYAPPGAAELGLPDSPDTVRMLNRLAESDHRNMAEEIYARTMEEFLISGLAVMRKDLRGNGVTSDYIQPDYFIIDTDMRDFRGRDASVVGEIHDVDFRELAARLAATPGQLRSLRDTYSSELHGEEFASLVSDFGSDDSGVSFLVPRHPGRCRVIELWCRELQGRYRCHDTLDGTLYRIPEERLNEIEAENQRRVKDAAVRGVAERSVRLIRTRWCAEEVWRYYFLTPSGTVIREGDSPYPDGGHPYVFKAYPFIDGEIHSFVADLIDQQRYVNRLVTLYDWVMRASAKGVLLFPESALPDGVDIDDISSEWSRFNGVILFKPKAGAPLPQQVSGNAANVGITELLQVQLQMMEDVSGVNGALQGKLESGSVSGTLYDQQTRHALTGLLDILRTFRSFIYEGVRKELSLYGIDAVCNVDSRGKRL